MAKTNQSSRSKTSTTMKPEHSSGVKKAQKLQQRKAIKHGSREGESIHPDHELVVDEGQTPTTTDNPASSGPMNEASSSKSPAEATNYRKVKSKDVSSNGPMKVYPGVPGPEEQVVAGLTLEDYAHAYPNHMYGAGLDPFIQREYTGREAFALMNSKVFYKSGVKKSSQHQLGNFMHKRMLARCLQLGESGLTALWNAPLYTYRRGNPKTPAAGKAFWLNALLVELAKDAGEKAGGRQKGPKVRYEGRRPQSPPPTVSAHNTVLAQQLYDASSSTGVAALPEHFTQEPDSAIGTSPATDTELRDANADALDNRPSTELIQMPKPKKSSTGGAAKTLSTSRQAARPARRAAPKKMVAKRQAQSLGPSQQADSAEDIPIDPLLLQYDSNGDRWPPTVL